MKTKRGQAALEFLMTYGWAILAIMITIGALAYFGVFNPGRTQSNRCIAQTGFACLGMPMINTTQVVFSLQNSLGTGIVLNAQNTTLPSECSAIYFCTIGDAACSDTIKTLEDGATMTAVVHCAIDREQIKHEYLLSYRKSGSAFTTSIMVTVAGRTK